MALELCEGYRGGGTTVPGTRTPAAASGIPPRRVSGSSASLRIARVAHSRPLVNPITLWLQRPPGPFEVFLGAAQGFRLLLNAF